MKFTTLAILPTAALAAVTDIVPRAGAPAIPNISGLTAAIDNTTAAVTKCTTAISAIEFKQGGGTDYSSLEPACNPIADGLEKIDTLFMQTVDPTKPESLAALAPLEQPLSKLLAEFEKLGFAIGSKGQGFLSTEVCPLLEQYGAQIEAEVTKFLKDFAGAVTQISGGAFGDLTKEADAQAKAFTEAFRKVKAEYCGTGATPTKTGNLLPSASPAAKNATTPASTTPTSPILGPQTTLVKAGAGALVPKAAVAVLAVAGAVFLL